MTDDVIKAISNRRSVAALAKKLGYENFHAIVETFLAVSAELEQEHRKEAQREEELNKAIEAALQSIPADLREKAIAKIAATKTAQPESAAPRKARASNIETVVVKGETIEVKMSGKVNEQLKQIMEDAGFTTKERKQFVEKFKAQ